MNKFSLAFLATLGLSACDKESVEITDITTYNAYVVSEILEVNDVKLTQRVPNWYVPESCETEVVPWAYSDPIKMITQSVVQMTCTQKYGPKQYIPISFVGPINWHIFGTQEVREFTLVSQDSVYTLKDVRWDVRGQVWDICDYIKPQIYNCK